MRGERGQPPRTAPGRGGQPRGSSPLGQQVAACPLPSPPGAEVQGPSLTFQEQQPPPTALGLLEVVAADREKRRSLSRSQARPQRFDPARAGAMGPSAGVAAAAAR